MNKVLWNQVFLLSKFVYPLVNDDLEKQCFDTDLGHQQLLFSMILVRHELIDTT